MIRFWRGAADLAVEVLSPDDRPAEIRNKVGEYLRRGTPLVLVIDPEKRTVTQWPPSSSPVTLTEVDTLDLDEVIEGFRCEVREPNRNYFGQTVPCSRGTAPTPL